VNFLSDNAAPVAPAILDAIVQANEGFAAAYGDDDLTRSVERRLSELFEREVAVFLVATGTASNALALAHLTPPWGAVLCHADSHIATDECGAPEFFSGGLKLVELPGDDGKFTAETLGYNPESLRQEFLYRRALGRHGPALGITGQRFGPLYLQSGQQR
jgi:threonine aldolase